MHDLFTLEHAGRLDAAAQADVPRRLPAIFAGLRISAGPVGDRRHRRRLLLRPRRRRHRSAAQPKYANNLDGEELFAAVIMSSLLGVAVFLFFGWLQKRVIGKWYEPAAR